MKEPNLATKRLFQMLELFRESQHPLSAGDIAEHLDCPKSSLNVLLRDMTALGYMTIDRKKRTYFPSPKLQHMSDWILDAIIRDPRLLAMIRDLREKTDETVVLSMRNDLEMEAVKVETSSQAISLTVQAGFRFPMWTSAVGHAMLAVLPSQELARLHDRATRQLDIPALDAIRGQLDEVRRRGCAISYGTVLSDVGAIAAPLTDAFGAQDLVISLGGPKQRVHAREQALVNILCRSNAVRKFT